LVRGSYHARRGCTMIFDGESVDCPGFPAEVADTAGAGDAFFAAVLHGLDQGWRAARIGDFANRVASEVGARRGAS
jgi:sugar/nucleoside kinase (ribokinase family)